MHTIRWMRTVGFLCACGLWAAATARADLTAGLVSHFPLDGGGQDAGPAGNHCTPVAVSYGNNRFGVAGRAAVFDSTLGAEMRCATPNGLPLGNGPRTLLAWINSGSAYTEQGILQYGTPAGNQMCGFIFSGNAGHRVYFYGHNNDFAPGPVVPLNEWVFTAMTFDGSTQTMYTNGQPDASRSTTLNTILDATGLAIGVRPPSTRWHGLIDDVRIYNRALTAEEIMEAYQADLPLDRGLVAHYLLNTNAREAQGTGRDGVIHGAVPARDRHGVLGGAMWFDGLDDYIFADGDGLPAAERTVSLWFKADQVASRPMLLSYGGGGGFGESWLMGLDNEGEAAYYLGHHYAVRTLRYAYSSTPTNEWHHFAATADANGQRIFVDGQLRAEDTGAIPTTGIPGTQLSFGVAVGAGGIAPYSDVNTGYFQGALDDIRIYDRVLPAADIQALYLHNPEFIEPAVTRLARDGVRTVVEGYGPPGRVVSLLGSIPEGGWDHGTGMPDYVESEILTDWTFRFELPDPTEPIPGGAYVRLQTEPNAPDLLLLHGEGPAGSTNVVDAAGNPVAALGGAAIDAGGRFEAGIAFAGGGARLAIPATTGWQIGAEDFSVDFWSRIDAFSTTGVQPGGILFIGDLQWGGAFNWGAWWYENQLYFSILGSSNVIAPWIPVPGEWNHIAFARRGGWTMMWVNGGLLASGRQASALTTIGPVTLGADKSGAGGHLTGRLDEVRALSGRTLANSAPPPAQAFAMDPGALILLHMDGPAGSTAFVDEAGHAVETLGSATVSAMARLGDGAGAFDGSGTRLSLPSHTTLALGTGDLTAEAWLNFDDIPAVDVHLFGAHTQGVWADWLVAYLHSTRELTVALNGTHFLYVPFTPDPGTWTHVAAVRRGGRMMIFVDGELRGAVNSPHDINSTLPVTLGATNNVTLPFKGRMDEFRLSRVARYTGDFIPPSRPYRLGD